MKNLKQFQSTPAFRLIVRALFAGVLAGFTAWRHGSTGGTVAWQAAAVAAGLAALEVLTPVNPMLGLFAKYVQTLAPKPAAGQETLMPPKVPPVSGTKP